VSQNTWLRAQAIEYLDNVLPLPLKYQLLPLLEASSEEEKVYRAGQVLGTEPPTLLGTLHELLDSRESWLKACGLHVVGSLRLREVEEQVRACSFSPDPLVQHTARWALGQLQRTNGGNMQVVQTLSVVQKAMLLMHIEVFKVLATDEVARIAAKATEARFDAGEVLEAPSKASRSLYIVIEGEIEETLHGQVLIRATKGMSVGFNGVLSLDEMLTHFRVVEPTHTLVLSSEDFKQAVADYPDFALGVIRGLGTALLNCLQKVTELEKALEG
jgi:CRP-like cAMP-binding protein